MVVYLFTKDNKGAYNINLSIDRIKDIVNGDFSFRCIKDNLFVLYNIDDDGLKPSLLIRENSKFLNEAIIKGNCLIVRLDESCRDSKGLVSIDGNDSFNNLSDADIDYIENELIPLNKDFLARLGLLYLEQSISNNDFDLITKWDSV